MREHIKRTTLILEDAVMEGVRDLAHRRGTEMSRVVNELLSSGLQRARRECGDLPDLPVFSLGRPRGNLADRDVLESLMEAE